MEEGAPRLANKTRPRRSLARQYSGEQKNILKYPIDFLNLFILQFLNQFLTSKIIPNFRQTNSRGNFHLVLKNIYCGPIIWQRHALLVNVKENRRIPTILIRRKILPLAIISKS